MATPFATFRTIRKTGDDTGARPCTVDSDSHPSGPISLSGFKEWREQTIVLAPGAADQAFTFTDVGAIELLSDYPFSWRAAAGETLWTNTRYFCDIADDVDTGVHQTSILLTGNGEHEAIIKAFVVEKL